MKWIATLLVFSVISCNLENSCSKSVTIIFSNKGTSAGLLKVYNGMDSIVIPANSNGVASKELCFNDSLKLDGHYTLRFSNDNRDTAFTFGYYTNGAPLEKGFQITWINDTKRLLNFVITNVNLIKNRLAIALHIFF